MSSPFGNNVPSNRSSVPDGDRPSSRVVRQLKPPPEIWELVHPVTTQKFKPGRSFLSRLTSNWMILVFLAFAVGILAGVGLAFWKNPAAKTFFSSFQAQPQTTEPKTTAPVSTATQQQASASTSAAPESSNAAAPAPEVTKTETPAAVETASEPAVTSEQTQSVTGVKPTHLTTRRASTDRSAQTTSGAATGVRVGSPAAANSPRQVVPDQGRGTDRTPTNPASTKPKANTAENPQVLTPVKQPAPTKAKVIPWP